jgi:hypothetical protein
VNICQLVADSKRQKSCFRVLLDNGTFKRLPSSGKCFDDSRVPPSISLKALFDYQKSSGDRRCVIPLRGRRILAVILANALLPFFNTPWLDREWDHTQIHFFQPMQRRELPSIAKPFLATNGFPAGRKSLPATEGPQQGDLTEEKERVHPIPSVLALGILLCELHFCQAIEVWRQNKHLTNGAVNLNTDYYAALDVLEEMEDEVSPQYYRAVEACLKGTFLPRGRQASFDSVEVQNSFYNAVVKPLEEELFYQSHVTLKDLEDMTHEANIRCWGSRGSFIISESPLSHTVRTGRLPEHRTYSHRNEISSTAVRSDEQGCGVLGEWVTGHVMYQPTHAREASLFDASFSATSKYVHYSKHCATRRMTKF